MEALLYTKNLKFSTFCIGLYDDNYFFLPIYWQNIMSTAIQVYAKFNTVNLEIFVVKIFS